MDDLDETTTMCDMERGDAPQSSSAKGRHLVAGNNMPSNDVSSHGLSMDNGDGHSRHHSIHRDPPQAMGGIH